MNWNEYFIGLAQYVSQKSKDPSTKVGAVLVKDNHLIVSTGYNGFPFNVVDSNERWTTRPDKYDYVVHAEQNAILLAARNGMSTKDCVLYLNYEPIPCKECVKSLVQAGVQCVIGPDVPFAGSSGNKEKWNKDLAVGYTMMLEGGVFPVLYKDGRLYKTIEIDWKERLGI